MFDVVKWILGVILVGSRSKRRFLPFYEVRKGFLEDFRGVTESTRKFCGSVKRFQWFLGDEWIEGNWEEI